MTRRVIIGVLVLLLVGAGIYLFVLRSPVEAPSSAMITVRMTSDAGYCRLRTRPASSRQKSLIG
jgi:hypothetical protein